MSQDIINLTQAMINLLAWFLTPFAVIMVIEWVVGLFKHD